MLCWNSFINSIQLKSRRTLKSIKSRSGLWLDGMIWTGSKIRIDMNKIKRKARQIYQRLSGNFNWFKCTVMTRYVQEFRVGIYENFYDSRKKPSDIFQHISYFSSGRLGGFVNLIFSILFQTFEILAWGIFFCGRERSDDEVSKMQSSDKFQYIMCSHGTPAPPDILLMMPNFEGRILKLLQI